MSSPLYRQVYETIRQRIANATYHPGMALPSEARLCAEFGVSRITARRAIHELALDGLVEQRQGLGSFVRSAPQDVEIGLASFTSDVASGNLRLVRTLLTDEIIAAPEHIAGKLGVQVGSLLRRLVRLDVEGSAPLSVDEVYVPPALAGSITPEIAASPLFVHLWQRGSDIRLVRTHYEIATQLPAPSDQQLLGIGADLPLLVTTETIFDSGGRAALCIVTRYRGDRCHLAGAVKLVQKRTKEGTVGE